MQVPSFAKYTDVLKAAGVQTGSARGFWGGVSDKDEIVVTTWIDTHDGAGRFYIWRPKTNHGRLRDQWDAGNIRVGTEVKVILLRQRGDLPINQPGREIAGAALLPGKWRVLKMPTEQSDALIESIE